MTDRLPHLATTTFRADPRIKLRPASAPEIEVEILHNGVPTSCVMPCPKDCASLVFVITVGTTRLLFTGDMRGKRQEVDGPFAESDYVEAALLTSKPVRAALSGIDVIKVPDHGSDAASSEDFLRRVVHQRVFAIITGGGSPEASVVQRYESRGAIVRRADVREVLCTRRRDAPITCVN